MFHKHSQHIPYVVPDDIKTYLGRSIDEYDHAYADLFEELQQNGVIVVDQDGAVHLSTDQLSPEAERMLRQYSFALPYNATVYADLQTYEDLGYKLYMMDPEDKYKEILSPVYQAMWMK